jgi:hypothetical protein
MAKIVHELGGTFIDLDNDLIDHKTNIVKGYYLNENPLNHHLSQDKLLNLLMNRIKSTGLKLYL